MKQGHLFSMLFMAVSLAGFICLSSCAQPAAAPSTQVILIGSSFAGGAEAAIEANNALQNATAAGCKAISVGGYGAASEGQEIGVVVLVECPQGTRLLPNGQAQ